MREYHFRETQWAASCPLVECSAACVESKGVVREWQKDSGESEEKIAARMVSAWATRGSAGTKTAALQSG